MNGTMRILLTALGICMLGAGPVQTGLSDYTVGPDDVIEVKVYDEEDLSREVVVTGEGKIALPLVGDVPVLGLTAAQIEDRLEALYGADYLKSPQIFVSVKEFRSKGVKILGAVRNPGAYKLTGTSTVLDVITLAGGVSESGGKNLLLLKATKDGVVEPTPVDLHRLLVEGDIAQNLPVVGGEIVFVPRGDEVYILGEVRNPGSLKFEEGMTLTQAITKTNGFTKTASKRVQIVRVENDKKTQLDVNVKRIESGKESDPILRARDLVVVPESIF